MTDTQAPELIWLDGDTEVGDCPGVRGPFEDRKYASEPAIAYIRKDISDARVAELEAELEDERDEFSRHQEKLSTEFEGECWSVLRSLIERVGYKWTSDDTSDGIQADMAHDIIRDAFSELEVAQGQMVASVKPLEWKRASRSEWWGSGGNQLFIIWGWMHIDGYPDRKHYEYGGARFDTLEEAKAAAQADYNERIISAITLIPHAEAKREGMLEAAEVAEHRHSKWTDISGVECDVTACADIADAIRAKADETK